MHHIVADCISMGLFVKDFIAFYQGDGLPILKLQYKDFSLWQKEIDGNREEREALERQGAYWLKELEGEIPLLNLPYDYARPRFQQYEGTFVTFDLDETKIKSLGRFGLDEDTPLSMVVLSVFYVLLSKICDQEDILVGIPAAGRRHSDLEQVFGFFINMLVLWNRPFSRKTFKEFLNEVKESTIKAHENQDYPFEELVNKVVGERDSSRNALFDVVFLWQNVETGWGYIPGVGQETGGLTLKPCYHGLTKAPYDMVFGGVESGETMTFFIIYKISLFKEETILTITRNFKEILSEVLENPMVQLGEITLSHDLLPAASAGFLEDRGDFGFQPDRYNDNAQRITKE